MNKEIITPMWDKMQFFCKEITDHQIRFILQFDTTLDDLVLKNAISIAVENNPIIGAKYVETQKQALVLGGINHPNLFQLGISTYRNELTMSIGSYYSTTHTIYRCVSCKETL